MSTKIRNQSKVKEKNKIKNKTNRNDSINAIDIICLSDLSKELAKVSKVLEDLLEKLCIDADSMKKLQKSFGSIPEIWDVKLAQEFLNMIIASAALGKPQLVKYKNWLVQVTSLTVPLDLNK